MNKVITFKVGQNSQNIVNKPIPSKESYIQEWIKACQEELGYPPDKEQTQEWENEWEQKYGKKLEPKESDLQTKRKEFKDSVKLTNTKGKPLSEFEVGDILAKNALTQNLMYDPEYDKWMEYKNNTWTPITNLQIIKKQLFDFLKLGGITKATSAYINGVWNIFTTYKQKCGFDDEPHLLPFKNGVFNLKTKQLEPHNKNHLLTWQIPYNYSKDATCKPFQQWLLETVGNDYQQVELLQAYLRACILREYKL